jgi:sporulation protein YlmC with PRC-barrel domain
VPRATWKGFLRLSLVYGTANRVEPYGTINRAEEVIQSDQMRASKIIGSAVYDVQNRKIGKVRDLVLDRSGQIAAMVVDVGTFLGMGGKNVGVKLGDVKTVISA